MDYSTLPSQEIVDATAKGLAERSVTSIVVADKAEALEKIKSLIPKGASIMNGSSVTLEQIGFVAYLQSGTHGWNNLHEGILAEKDPVKQSAMRKQAVLSDYYLGSVHALAQTGEFVIASNTGSQLPHIVFTSPNLIFVVSTKKIVPTLADAMKRLEEHVVPMEDEHMKQKHGVGTSENKVVIFKRENPKMGRTVTVILVREDLGF